jgi:hypothetical protein
MRAAAVLLFAACVLTLFPATASATSPPPAPDAAQTGYEESYEAGSSIMLPEWRLGVRLYGSFGDNLDVGIYRRVRNRYELGLGISGDLDFSSSETVSTVVDTNYTSSIQTDTDRDDLDVTIYSELRRWHKISEDVMWYFGPRLSFRFSDVESETRGPEWMINRTESNDYVFGGSLVAGGDLRLLKHLSLSFSFIPFKLAYTWRDSERIKEYPYSGALGERRSVRVEEDRKLSLDFEPRATAFLNLVF